MKLATISRNAGCNAIVDLVDAGSGAGTLDIYSGSPPANPQTSPSGTLLASLVFSDPGFGGAATGVATASAITPDSSADASGTAGWFRIADSDGNAILDGTITITSGGGDIEFDDIDFIAGGEVTITSLTADMPES